MAIPLKCYNCGAEIPELGRGRQDSCEKCGRDVHVCRNCVNWDRAYNNECRESQAERVVDKEKSNFCDWWKPRSGAGGLAASRDTLKSAADALFRKK